MRKYWVIFFAFILFACQKNTPAGVNQNKEISAFNIGSVCQVLLPGSANFVDSTLQFVNISHLQDTTNPGYKPSLSYQWDFGDHSSSSEKSPRHQYSLPGTYTVRLSTYIDNQLSDSSSAAVQIIMGLREFKMNLYSYAIDMDQADQKGALTLYAANTGGSTRTFGILRVDSLLHIKWFNPIPGDDNSVRLSSIKRIDNKAYILSGNYSSGNTNTFCLSKIDSSGNLVWSTYINNLTGTNDYTIPVADGGFLTTGTATISGNYFAAMVKCDANGNEVWRRIYDSAQSLTGINNVLETDSGYVFAAETTELAPRLVLTDLDLNGNIRRQASIAPAYPIFSGKAGVLFYNNGYFVYPTDPGINNYVYLVNSDFSFGGSQIFGGGLIQGGFKDGGNIVVYSHNNQYSELNQILSNGTAGWQYTVDPIIYLSCNSQLSGARRTCRQAIYSSGNEIIILSDGENINNTQSLYLLKMTPDGKVK